MELRRLSERGPVWKLLVRVLFDQGYSRFEEMRAQVRGKFRFGHEPHLHRERALGRELRPRAGVGAVVLVLHRETRKRFQAAAKLPHGRDLRAVQSQVVTPARLISWLITGRGVVAANRAAIAAAFPERAASVPR